MCSIMSNAPVMFMLLYRQDRHHRSPIPTAGSGSPHIRAPHVAAARHKEHPEKDLPALGRDLKAVKGISTDAYIFDARLTRTTRVGQRRYQFFSKTRRQYAAAAGNSQIAFLSFKCRFQLATSVFSSRVRGKISVSTMAYAIAGVAIAETSSATFKANQPNHDRRKDQLQRENGFSTMSRMHATSR